MSECSYLREPPFVDSFRIVDDSGLTQIHACCAYEQTRKRHNLEQSEMVWILGLQRAHQNLKPR